MELRKVPYTGSRWVHIFCIPKDIPTLYYLNTIKEMCDDTGHDFNDDEIYDIIEKSEYWIHETDDIIICKPNAPTTFEKQEYKNLCLECGIDMGPQNPRQLCGKYICLNIDIINEDSCEIDNEELEN